MLKKQGKNRKEENTFETGDIRPLRRKDMTKLTIKLLIAPAPSHQEQKRRLFSCGMISGQTRTAAKTFISIVIIS